jgi:transposase
MARHVLTDQEWNAIKDELPPEDKPRRGRPWVSHRMVISGILWILNAGAPWRDLPESFGKWKTVYNRFRRWTREGLWDRLWTERLQELSEEGLVDEGQWDVDGSVIRAHRCAAGARTPDPVNDPEEPADHALGRSQGGFSTKIHLVVEGHGVTLGLTVTPGQRHESKEFENVMESVSIVEGDEDWPDALAGDKAYSSTKIRVWMKDRRIEDVIPTRSNETPNENFDKEKYRKRNIVERVIGWLKESRRVATRYEKRATHYLAMVKLAIFRRLLHVSA